MDGSGFMNCYLEAKAIWKKDFKRLIIFSLIWTVILFFSMITSIHVLNFETFTMALFGSLVMGIMVECAVVGVIKTFAFAWRILTGWSIIIFLLVLVAGVMIGSVYVLVKLVTGFIQIRKMGKILRV